MPAKLDNIIYALLRKKGPMNVEEIIKETKCPVHIIPIIIGKIRYGKSREYC
jgi:hypothetical protein